MPCLGQHGGTVRHGTAKLLRRIVPCLAGPGLAVPVLVPCRAVHLANYNIRYYPDGETEESIGWIEFYQQLNHINARRVDASYMFSFLDNVGEPVLSYCLSDGVIRTFNNSS